MKFTGGGQGIFWYAFITFVATVMAWATLHDLHNSASLIELYLAIIAAFLLVLSVSTLGIKKEAIL
jgi:hypothetical protein